LIRKLISAEWTLRLRRPTIPRRRRIACDDGIPFFLRRPALKSV
jgi:hypothetical protein